MRFGYARLGAAVLLAAAPAAAQMQPRDLGPSGPPAQQQQQAPPQAPPQQQAPPPQRQAPPPAPTGNVWQTIETSNYGQWTYTALRHTVNGTASCAVHTHWHDTGRQLRIVALEQPVTINLALSDPRWTLRDNASSQGTIQVDGASFTAEFLGIGPTAMSTRLASGSEPVRRFIASFRAGNAMRVTLPGDAFAAGLRGSSAAMDAMTRCIGAYFGQPRAPAAPPAPAGTKG